MRDLKLSFARSLCFKQLHIALATCSLALLSAQQVRAQTQSHLRIDASASAIISKSINAMGGGAVWSPVLDTTVTGACETPSPEDAASSVSAGFVWVTKGMEFRYETDRDDSKVVYVSGHGRPRLSNASVNSELPLEYSERRLPFHLPALVFRDFLGQGNYTLVMDGEETVSDTQAIHIRVAAHSGPAKLQGAEQEWWFSSDTGLPIKVSYLLPAEDGSHYLHLERTFGAWSPEGNLIIPHKVIDFLDEQSVLQSCTIRSIAVNTKPAESLFEVR